MKSKSPLVMIEQMVMVLVFALAATLCVKMFVLSGNLADKYEDIDWAVLAAQNVAEECKAVGITQYLAGSGAVQTGEDSWTLFLDENWKESDEKNADYSILIDCKEENGWLWQADITVYSVTGEELFSIPVAAQKQTEVADYEKD